MEKQKKELDKALEPQMHDIHWGIAEKNLGGQKARAAAEKLRGERRMPPHTPCLDRN